MADVDVDDLRGTGWDGWEYEKGRGREGERDDERGGETETEIIHPRTYLGYTHTHTHTGE